MKYLIASDIHGSALYCGQLMEAFEREGADMLLLLGDILYHGPRNDLPDGYAPKKVIPMLNAVRDRILCVRGNCDAEVDQMVLEFPITADCLQIVSGDRVILATHGHVYNTGNLPPMASGSILLHGHTHVQANERHGSFLYLNPGSVSIPKDGTERSYMILENGSYLWRKLPGEPMEVAETSVR